MIPIAHFSWLQRFKPRIVAVALAVFISLTGVLAAEPPPGSFDGSADQYRTQTRPLLQQFCLECHSTAKQEGDLDLERFAALADVRRGTRAWLKVVEMLDNGEMPPAESNQPSSEQRMQLRGWVERYLHAESLANAGDPGSVALRRLNNAEYTCTIRDLTGVDFDPAREFPTDSAAGEGFTSVCFEMQEESVTAIHGFALADCPPIDSDAIEEVVKWNVGSHHSALAGRLVQVRFVMIDIVLSSIRFRD